ncbi:hypothetical protein DVH24_026738 [Malus domestica]|uniref:6-phosphogluconate dehydrogenase NADP-binding domain-containing protein n=1 Tax=Malus domestica TaxID=3750 RepID=A0A498K474_MALDO|nr:hypothetical protein DVH24_026738 [Malus domestica]
MEASPALSHIGLAGLAVMGQNLAFNIAEKGFPISVYNPSDFVLSIERPRSVIILVKAGGEGGRGRRRKENAENTERMHRCRTSAIRHTVLRLSGWQSLSGLSLGPFLVACPPSNQQRCSPIPWPSGPFSSPVPRATSNGGVALIEEESTSS